VEEGVSDQADYYREKWMNDEQWECALMLADLMRGFHHIGGKIKAAGKSGIECNQPYGHWATYDFDGLTRAVIMAHDRCIRFEIQPSGPGRLRLFFHKRQKREGSMYERHPTLEQAIEHLRPKVSA
jgi:hypothetical protein